MRLPDRVTLCEVGPRDGLQNEPANVPTADKIRLIEALVEAGIRRMEATSFVAPKWIPNLADAGEVLAGLRRRPGVTYAALVPNLRGLERALAAKVDEVVIFLSASETHSRKNINKSLAEALEASGEVAGRAKHAGLRLKGAISTCFGCPYEGEVDPRVVVRIATALVDMGVDEVGISDTTGMANPRQVDALVSRVAERVPVAKLSLHFHDTRGTALANVLAGLQAGVTIFDGSIGGLGGCPYAKGATGNVATEDLVHMLHEMGIETGTDLPKLIECARLAQQLVGRPLEAHVGRAGPVNHGGGGAACS
ncbi:MAG: hydroxymethylglutaryl-CoA lyase [candidate division NC10 bacterium]|nr:hydroxymethylglutaryl-CoA lyase [candidate division NC10 bacterium]